MYGGGTTVKIERNKFITDRVAKEYADQIKPGKGQGQPQVDAAKSAQETASPSVSISNRAKLLSKARVAFTALPEVRSDVVSKIKDAVDAGSYSIPTDKVAAKMVERLSRSK